MNAEQTVEQIPDSRSFIAKWVIVTTLTAATASMLGFGAMWSVGDTLSRLVGETFGWVIAGGTLGALVGLGIGGGQAFALGSSGRRVNPARWTLNSVIGGGVVTAVAFGLVSALSGPNPGSSNTLIGLILGSVLGLGIGVGQWLTLRRQLPGSGIWILITLVALLAAFIIGLNLGGEGREIIAVTAFGLIAAAITGLGAVWLFRGRNPAVAGQVGLLIVAGLLLAGCGGSTDPIVRFAEPRDGASVAAPVRVVMAAENFTVEPAGDGSVHDGAGHLHIMVDTPCVAAGDTIPKDETHLHFGDGSTETELALEPGSHTLCLQAADGAHTALPGEGMTHTISVTVP
jgi:hypothetical protein